MQTLTKPRADSSTYLIHLFGTGLDADDRFVVERFRSRADGEIVPVDGDSTGGKARRRKRRTVIALEAVEKLRPARDEIIVATGLSRSGGLQAWGSYATGLFVQRRQRG